MTTPDAHTVISVRGESQQIVAADQASIFVSVQATGATTAAAASDVARDVAAVTAELAELGGERLTTQTIRNPLTWSTQSIHTAEEHTFDKITGAKDTTGLFRASASVHINVRDFQLLGRIQGILTRYDTVSIGSVQWSADEDNPAWAQVRADAIRAALHKGQDYASALGGSIASIEHIADAGLLGGDAWAGAGHRASRAVPLSLMGGMESTSLDPVPQVIAATIDARLTATVGPLPSQ